MTSTGPIDRFGIKVGNQVPDPTAFVPTADLAIKTPVLCATTVNITLSGLQTIDAVALAEGNRVLVKNQTDQATNGIYAASSGIWSRTNDASGNDDLVNGTQVAVISGAVSGNKTFTLMTADIPIVVGTSLLVWQVVTYPNSEFGFIFDGGGAAILPGQECIVPIPFGYTIIECDVFADRAGSLVADIVRYQQATFPAGGASICAADRPTLAAAQKSIDTVLAGWTLIGAKDDVLVATVISNDLVRNLTIALKVTRN